MRARFLGPLVKTRSFGMTPVSWVDYALLRPPPLFGDVILSGAAFQAEGRISRGVSKLRARFLGPLVKTRSFGMTSVSWVDYALRNDARVYP